MKILIPQKIRRILLMLVFMLPAISIYSELVAHFPMTAENGKVKDVQTGQEFNILGNFPAENVPGAEGMALRFDGYTTQIPARINSSALNGNTLTFSLWCAIETYPMVEFGHAVNTSSYIAGNLDNANRKGFAFTLSAQGNYAFECYSGGWKVSCAAPGRIPKYTWNYLVAVVNTVEQTVKMYCNGNLVSTVKTLGDINPGDAGFIIGKSFEDKYESPFLLNTFNGLIDDIKIYSNAVGESEIKGSKPQNEADLSIPKSRFENDILRPVFHGMPAAAWTNEPHGLVKFNGKYHVFFQKNANGPYMSRLHWGHISSTDLCKWKEEKIAIDPSEPYDIKGCWSGCIFTDDVLTKGKPYIFYTAVDNGRATIAQATPADDDLINWNKRADNPVINGRPDGLSSDFRDPYMFKSNGKYYMIVGTSKDDRGATTLHRYNSVAGTWSNDGSIFFQTKNASISGTFWEMPNITPIGDKWLFTTTPLNSPRQGVEVQYWTGSINDDGTFVPLPFFTNQPQEVELGNFGKDGFGLLSPSITTCDGKTIAMGIVPDKLPGNDNHRLGWAHTYSLPREWSLDSNGFLIQKPFSGLTAMRTSTVYSKNNETLNGSYSMAPVEGRKAEIRGEFIVGTAARFGFKLFKTGNKSVDLYYVPSANKLVVDMTSVDRLINDSGVYNGLYESTLPKPVAQGSKLTIHAFIDHSIMDIFINDQWAFSMRVFPTDKAANGIEVFSDGNTMTESVTAWVLDENYGGVSVPGNNINSADIHAEGNTLCYSNVPGGSMLTVYDITGRIIINKQLVNESGKIDIDFTGMVIANLNTVNGNYVKKIML